MKISSEQFKSQIHRTNGERKHPQSLTVWSLFNMIRFKLLGIQFGGGLRCLGPVLLRVNQGVAGNISLGRNVTLFPYVDLRVRENGKIYIRDGVYIETMVRLVAANEAILEIGAETQIGLGTIINAGADIRIGAYGAIAAYCNIVASEHAFFDAKVRIKKQGYIQAPITIGQDVWLANGVLVRPGVTIGEGAVIGAKSVVHNDLPSYVLAAGNPATVIKKRETRG